VPRTLLVATKKGLFHFQRRGKGSWKRREEPAFLAVPVSMVLQDPRDGVQYAALDHGHFGVKLHRSKNGTKWQEIGVPALPQLPEGQEEREGMGRPWPRKLRLVWSLAVDPLTDGGLWCGTIPGGLFHSNDRGTSWELVQGLWDRPERLQWFGGGYDVPGIHSICVDPRDGRRVTVGVSCGGVWRTEDAGATWHNVADGMHAAYMPAEKARDPNIQDPHRVVQCAAAPDRFWAQHHNGIFRTQDDGSWREVKAKAPSRFGFACAVHPGDPDVAWFVPAVKDECRVPVGGRLVVIRTRDGGKTFDVLKQGLPKADAWDLVYRHGLDVTADGRTLAMGSTTGGLWVSEDGGRAWTEVSSHLPPVYAVHFAPA
jgi:photosystem II stability/assembly factor-like uncharacterized protein